MAKHGNRIITDMRTEDKIEVDLGKNGDRSENKRMGQIQEWRTELDLETEDHNRFRNGGQ